ncbi:2-dehydropantoate 2-reductase [Aestuariibacter salexigens]|uniref:2-dehydropantoate 2-reductase n=1 Tax=Aestuariibacter salexigens TaxID=226010 RepID=UPI0012EC5C60|nr:2-dehydropantoate 2-reductase [Aestuariibacter salexigens]
MQQHVVFGAGLIGRYLGAVMANQGVDVRLVCRPAIALWLSDGVKLTDYQQHSCEVERLNVIESDTAGDSSATPSHADVLWLTVKCTGVEAAASAMAPFVGPDTTIICCQNGLGSDHIIKQHYPDNRVLRGMVPFNVVEMSRGHLHRGSQGTFTIEIRENADSDIVALSQTINCGLLPCAVTTKMTELLWAKLQLNLGNSINALADIPVKAMLEQRGYRKVIAAMMKELLMVTKAQGITLPKVGSLPGWLIPHVLRLPDALFQRVANKMLAIDPNVRTSMWWDIHQGRQTEIQYLNGAVVEAGSKLSLPCPVNTAIIDLIKQQEASRKAWSADELLAHIS